MSGMKPDATNMLSRIEDAIKTRPGLDAFVRKSCEVMATLERWDHASYVYLLEREERILIQYLAARNQSLSQNLFIDCKNRANILKAL